MDYYQTVDWMDYYQKVDQINRRLANQKELDHYIEDHLFSIFDWMDKGDSYLNVKMGEPLNTMMGFRLTEDSTVESLKKDMKNQIDKRIKLLQTISDSI